MVALRKQVALIIACVLLLTGGSYSPAAEKVFMAEDLLKIHRIYDPQPSPDGKTVLFTTATLTKTILSRLEGGTCAVDRGTKQVRLLTPLPLEATNPRWQSDGKVFYFLANSPEGRQVWRMTYPDGQPEQVTHLPLDVEALEVVPMERRLIIVMSVFTNKTPAETAKLLAGKPRTRAYESLPVRHWDTWWDGTRRHLFLYDLDTGASRDLMEGMDTDCPSRPLGGTENFSLSPDGRFLVFSAKRDGFSAAWSTNFDLFLVPLDRSAAPLRITDNAAADIQPRYAPDGRTLAYLAARQPGNEADRYRIVLRDMNADTERFIDLRAEDGPQGDRSPTDLVWSHDGKILYVTADHLGQHVLFILEVATGKGEIVIKTGAVAEPRPLPGQGVIFAWASLRRPGELYTWSPKGGEQVTKLNDELMDSLEMGPIESFRFPDSKDHEIHGFVALPPGGREGKWPVAFIIHGGPETSYYNDFSYRWNPHVFTARGYAVVSIDFPGSRGYGQAYTDLVYGDWGGRPYEELMEGLKFLLQRYPFLDGDRMAALGPSFGGYMVNWIGVHHHPFRCLVTHGGIFDKGGFYYQTDELWFPEWEFGGTPWGNRNGHRRQNPADHIDRWQTPTLILHGEKDYRVPYIQGYALFTALQRQGVPSRFVLFPEAGHWILSPSDVLTWYGEILAWLDRWLKK